MQYDTNTKPDACISKEAGRYAMHAVKLDLASPLLRKRPALVATNGVAMVAIPVEIDVDDKAGLIPREAFLQARALFGKDEVVKITTDGRANVLREDEVLSSLACIQGEFPLYAKAEPKGQPRAVVSFDIGQMRAIAIAMGTDVVTIEVFDNKQAIRVRPATGEAVGLLMPVTVEGELYAQGSKDG